MIRGPKEYREEGQRVFDALRAAMPDVTIVGIITGLGMLLDHYIKSLHSKEQASDSADRVMLAQLAEKGMKERQS